LEGLALAAILALVIVVSRWAIAGASEIAQAPDTAISIATPVVFPTATFTPAPTYTPTVPPTPTYTPTPSPTATPTHTPTPSPTPHPPDALPGPPTILTDTNATPQPLPIPSPMPLVEQSEDVINILLLGSDRPSTEGVGLTDVIIVVSINPELPSVSLLSIPRDFYAWIPTQGFNKINLAYHRGERDKYPGGGSELIKATVEYNLGIRIHYCAYVGFDGFVKIVDMLGGVDVAVECPLSDTFPDPDSPTGQTDVDWLPGVYHLDGKHTLWYARSRWSTHDFDRNRRQHQVLRGLYHQAVTLDVVPKIPQLWETLNETVSTDLGLDELIYLGAIGSQLDMANVSSGFVGRGVLQVWTAPNGAYVLVPYYDALGAMVEQVLAPPASGRGQQHAFRVEVWNGTAEDGLGHVAAERLRWEGFEVVDVVRIEGDYPRTQVWDFTTTAKGSPLLPLMRLYGRYSSDVISQPTEERQADFLVVLGADYDPCMATRIHWQPDEALPTPTPLPASTATP